jgi:eukaryotic-like serine/threonine-protein kinase
MNLDKIESYYEKFLTLDELAKKEFLLKIASEEPAIYTQFVSLYQHDTEASRFFNEIEAGVSQAFFDTGYEPGKVVGNYRLEQAIGAGGMAYVYKAERIDGVFQRASAIKFIKRGIDTQEVIRRFNHERNILARLKHEHIAQLYDGGVSDDGLPYFVMEYITGKDIISHGKENKLNLKQRLELFLQVCAAVDFAHKNLIIHRDIKPSNILIDENGKAKLTDFGIAKLLDDQAGEELTQLQSRVMTKEYASPEQQKGDFITTTSDVYQLGVLLYELITGLKAWSHTEKKHQFTFDKKLIPSELKSIVQTATREEPEKRYNSVEAFLQDVENYLEDKPVKARGDSVMYIGKKFIIRNKKTLFATSLLIMVIAIGLTKYIVDINEARLMAEYRTQQTRNTLNVIMTSLSSQYPIFSDGDTLNVFQLINKIEMNINNTQINEEFKAIFFDYLAEFYKLQENYDIAIDYYQKALNEFSKLQNIDLYKNYRFDIYSNLGYCYLFTNLDSANVYYEYAIFEARNNSLACINPLSGIAYIHTLRGNYDKADSCYVKALSNSSVDNSYNATATAITLARYGSFLAAYNLHNEKNLDSMFDKSLNIYNLKLSEFNNKKDIIFRDISKSLKENELDSYAEMLNYYGMYLYRISKYDSAQYYF